MPRTEVTGSQIKDKSVVLTDDVTGVLPVANGGSGSDNLPLNAVLLGNGTGALQAVAPGAAGWVLTSNGTNWVASAPSGGAGSVGPTGPTGPRGSVWYQGTGSPGEISGQSQGDFYLNTQDAQVFQLTAQGWAAAGYIRGATGPAGPAGSTGPTGPAGSGGATGPTGPAVDNIAVINDSLQFYIGGTAIGSPVVVPGAIIDGGSPTTTSLGLIDGGTL